MSYLRAIGELSTSWLSEALGTPVRAFTVEPVGTGQSASTYRVTLESDGGPDTVILKIADPDPAVRRTGVVTGQYRQEVTFYRKIASQLPQEALTTCHLAAYDEEAGYFTLLLEDVSPAKQGDQLVGCDLETARRAVVELARLLAPTVGRDDLAEQIVGATPVSSLILGMLLPKYFDRFAHRMSDEHRTVVEQFAGQADTWLADEIGPRSIVHNDYRLDNMLFADVDSAKPLTVVDWATLQWGSVTSDLSYFIGGNLTLEDRRLYEKELVKLFHAELKKLGVKGFTFAQCWRGYCWESFAGVLMAIGAPMVVSQTERGDEMFMTMLARHAQQAIDIGACDLLAAAHKKTLEVDPADEFRHPLGDERFWNESYYADAISDDGKLGAYVRVGLVPHLGHVVYTAYVVGEGRPSVGIIDYTAPLPESGMAVTTHKFTSDLTIEEPLKRFRATVAGLGESFADPSAALRGEAGEPVAVEFDLVWETEGTPYKYPVATRYELPCRVTGTIKVGDEVLRFAGPGQRDHSWGDRNWWSMDWTWASAHLDDETRIQVIEARVPGLPVLAAGYEQRGDELVELKHMTSAYDIPASRMPGRTTSLLEPSGTAVTWEPIAYGPLRIVAPDGRVCEFPRAMARITTADGRTGLGWLEWGHNMPASVGLLDGVKSLIEGSAKSVLGRVPESAVASLMKGRVGHGVVAALFKALPGRIDPDGAQAHNARIRFKVGNEGTARTDVYDLVLSVDALPRVEKIADAATAEPARVTLTISGADLVLMGAGSLDTLQAAIDRRFVLEGDQQFMTVLAPLLAGPDFPAQQPLGG